MIAKCVQSSISTSPNVGLMPHTIKHIYLRDNGIDCFILEWTTSLDSSSGTLICPSLCPRHVGRNNYVPLFGVDPIEWRLTRYYVIRDVTAI